jgi:hypothetical protein
MDPCTIALQTDKQLLAIHNMNRSELINNYAYQIMEGMDMKTMECFVIDCLTDNLNSYTDEELIAEVTEYNPELLEECDS